MAASGNTCSFSLTRGTNSLSDHLDTPFAGLVLKENGLIFTRPVEWTASPKGRQIELLSGGISSLFHGPLTEWPPCHAPLFDHMAQHPMQDKLAEKALISLFSCSRRIPSFHIASRTQGSSADGLLDHPLMQWYFAKAHLPHASLLLSVMYRFFTYFYAPHILYLAFTLSPPGLPFSLSTCPELLRGHQLSLSTWYHLWQKLNITSYIDYT